MRVASVILFAVLTFPVFGNTPEEVVTEYLGAVKSGEMDDLGKYFHLDVIVQFREGVEPLIAKSIRNRSDRQMFGAFIDPYDPKTLRSLSDVEFMSAYARWIQTWKKDALSMLEQTDYEVLGHVPDGDKSQVVIRLKANFNGTPWESMVIRATKEYEGTHLLLLTPEFATAAEFMRDNLGRR